MYKKIILHKDNIFNKHLKKLNQYKSERKESEDKIHEAYLELKKINYNDTTSFTEIQSMIIYLREYITILKKEVNFYNNYIKHESKTVLKLNIDLEKYKHLQHTVDLENKRRQDEEEEEEMLDLINTRRKKT